MGGHHGGRSVQGEGTHIGHIRGSVGAGRTAGKTGRTILESSGGPMHRILRRACLAVSILVLASPGQAQGTAASAPADARWTLGSPKPVPAAWEVALGTGKLKMASGQATPILLSGRVVGAYLQGAGSFYAESVDPDEFPVIRTTLEKNGLPKATPTGRGLSLEIPVNEACLWIDGQPGLFFAEAAGTGAGTPNAAAFEAHQAVFRRRGGFTLGTRLREHLLNAPGTPWAVLELRGPKGSWVFRHDPDSDKVETFSRCMSLVSQVKGEGQSLQELYPVFSRPLGRTRNQAPVPDITLVQVALEASSQDARNLRTRAVERFQVHRPGMRAMALQVLDRTYDVYGATGVLEPHTYHVNSVRDAQGAALRFRHEQDSLLVEFEKPLDPARPCEIQVEMEGDVLLQPQGDNYWILQEAWFPMPRLHERAFTVEARLTSRKPFLPLLPGTQVSSKESGQDVTVQSRIERPVQMYWALAGKYTTIQDTRNGQTIRVASYALSGNNAKLVLDVGFDAVKFYEGFLGPFPFKEYLIAQVPQLGFGIAPPALQLITSEAFQPFNGTITQLYTQGINHRIAHEVAHQYWPHVAHLPEIDHAWLSEAFAEYSSALFIRASRGEVKFDMMASAWRDNAAPSASMASLGTANRLANWSEDPVGGQWARNHLVYDKGALVLHAIRKELGDVPFLKYLRALQLNFNGKQISVEHLQGVLDAMTRKDHSAFFQAYVSGAAMPPK